LDSVSIRSRLGARGDHYTITSANDAPERDPANWALLGSNDGGATWATLDTQINQVFTDRYETRAFPIATRRPITSTACASTLSPTRPPPSPCNWPRFSCWDSQKYTYWWSFGDGTTASSEQIGAPIQQQHTYANNGTYTVVLGVTYGVFSGTNTIQINIGPPLAATATATLPTALRH